MDKRPISISMIAHNEAHNIRRCLDSVVGWASEIVIVVNDCTDGTDTIAEEGYGATVVHHPWQGFRDQKNLSLEHATQPWVLCLDADEEVSPALRDAILAVVDADDPQLVGARFPRKVWFLGRWITHGEWYPDHVLRLLRRDRGRWIGGEVHERLELDGAVTTLPHDLHHYSFPELNGQIYKLVGYSDLFLKEQLDAGARWSAPGAISRAAWRFVRHYILKRGFLDGFPGFYIGCLQAYMCLYKYTRLYEHQQKAKEPPPE